MEINRLVKPYISPLLRRWATLHSALPRICSKHHEEGGRKPVWHHSSAGIWNTPSSKTAVFKRKPVPLARQSKCWLASKAKPLASVPAAAKFQTDFTQLIGFQSSPHINSWWLPCILIVHEALQVSGVGVLVCSIQYRVPGWRGKPNAGQISSGVMEEVRLRLFVPLYAGFLIYLEPSLA